jgi:hypothetical protein
MATSRTTVIQSLSIALIVFVMLTFVLAVTTYLFFTQKELEVAKTVEANAAAEQAKQELETANAEKERLQEIIGFEADRPFEEVENETTQTLETKFGDYLKETKSSYDELVKKLKESADEKDKAVLALQEEKKQLAAQAEAELKARDEKVSAVEKELEAIKADAASEKEKLEKAVAKEGQERQSLAQKYDEALKKSGDFQRLKDKVAEGAAVVTGGRREQFEGQSPEDRVTAIIDELRERERAVARANQVLATLRAKDPAVQDAVMAATPKDDRIEGFDGRVVSVNEVDRTVLILAPSTRGMRPGLILSVYGPDDPTPPFDADKGLVEVVAIESPTLARARIRRDIANDPILGGDGVATSLWTPGESFEAVILGFVQIDRDDRPDADRLQELVESVGGSVAPLVSPQTTMVVDAGEPRSVGTKPASGWRQADSQRRERQLNEARRLGLKVVGLDPFLRMLGLERDSLDANRLPVVAGAGAAESVLQPR